MSQAVSARGGLQHVLSHCRQLFEGLAQTPRNRGFVLGCCAVLFSAVSHAQGAAGAPPALAVSVIQATPTTLPNILEITAQAEGAKETEVRARVGGILVKRLYEEGRPVVAGQPLFQLDPEPFKNAFGYFWPRSALGRQLNSNDA